MAAGLHVHVHMQSVGSYDVPTRRTKERRTLIRMREQRKKAEGEGRACSLSVFSGVIHGWSTTEA